MPNTEIFPLQALPSRSLLRTGMALYDHTEPPLSFRFAALLYALSAAVGKRVWINLGDRKTYPCISILLVAPSGTGKSTCINQSREILEKLTPERKPFITNLGTPQKLLKTLELFPRIAILSSELSAQLGKEKYLESLIPLLTDLLDQPEEYRTLGTKHDGETLIKRSELFLFGATTREWLEDQMPNSAVQGGWLPRHLVLYEDRKHQSVPIPRRLLGRGGLEGLEARKKVFQEELSEYIAECAGELDFADVTTEDAFCDWAEAFQISDVGLAPFQERAREQVLKLSILICLSCKEKAITTEHLNGAIAILEYSHTRLSEVAVRFTPAGKLHKKVLQLLELAPNGMSIVEIRQSLLNSVSARETDKIIESLILSRKIEEKDARFVLTK